MKAELENKIVDVENNNKSIIRGEMDEVEHRF
jgi:hypothetical protein